MANKHLSEDEIKYVISAETSKAQQEIHKLGKETASLRKEEKARRQAMIELEAAGKKNSEQYIKLKEECKAYTKEIAENEKKMKDLRSSLDVSVLTMNQLKKYAKELRTELDNTSKEANPKQYAELETRLQGVGSRMEELKVNSKSLRETFINATSLSVMAGNVMTKLGELFGSWLHKISGYISDTVSKSVELAESADGITHAFEKIDRPGYLESLRKATKGTVSDIELMKAAVKAKDFRIPLEDLGKYLAFAQLKAQQTGQSLDYMVDSIVTGLGRKSPLILDNLGLSAAEIGEKTKKTGDFMKGVASIVENQLAAAGETYISAADRAAQRTVALKNAQKSLGDALLPLQEEFSDLYGRIQLSIINVIKYLVQHRDTLIALGKGVAVLTATYLAYVAGQKMSYLWGLCVVAVSKLKAAAVAVENVVLELSVLRHSVLNKTMTKSIALQKAFNVVLKLSPWGLILGSITLVVGALLMFNKRTDAATVAQKKLKDIQSEASRKVEEERIKIEMLTKRIHDNSLSLAERQDAIAALQKIVPDYTAKLTREGKVYDENTRALTRYLNALKEKALLEGAQSAIKDLGKQKAELIIKQRQQQKELDDLKKEQSNFAKNNAGRPQTSGGAVAPGYVNAAISYSGNVSAMSRQLQDTADKIKVIDTSLDIIGKEFGKKLFTADGEGSGNSSTNIGTIGAALDAIKKKIEALKAKRLTIKIGDTKGLKAIDRQIAQLEDRKARLEYKSGGGKNKKNKTSNPDDTAAKQFFHDREQDLSDAKRAYQEDLNALQKALAEKKLTQQQYNAFVSALAIEHQNNLLAIETSYQERSKDIQIKDASKKKSLQESQDKAVLDQKQAAANAYIEAEKQYYGNLDKIREMSKSSQPQTLQQELDAKLLILDGYYKASLQLAKDDGERQKQITEAYEKAKAQIVSEWTTKTEEHKYQVRQQYGLTTFDEYIAKEKQRRKNDYDNGSLSEQQYKQSVVNLEKDAEEHRFQIRQQYGLASQKELYNAELAQLKQHLDNKEISEEEYEEAVKQMKIAKYKEIFDYYSNLFGGAIQSLQDAEAANVDAKYDAEIEAAKNAGKDTTELEKKKANEKLKIQKKYADVNFAIKASQIISDTAVSIMKAYGELGPIAGSVAAALMGVTGAAQLKAANAERQKVKKMTLNGAGGSQTAARVATGLESGGSIDVEREQDGKRFHAAYEPMKRGFVDKPTVIVGEGAYGRSREWVASNAAVENPTVAPLIDIIDRAQRAGTIRTLDMNKWLIQQAQGRVSGGFVGASSPIAGQGQGNESRNDKLLARLADAIDRLSNDGIPAYVGIDELDAKQKIRERYRNIGRK